MYNCNSIKYRLPICYLYLYILYWRLPLLVFYNFAAQQDAKLPHQVLLLVLYPGIFTPGFVTLYTIRTVSDNHKVHLTVPSVVSTRVLFLGGDADIDS